MEKLTRHVKEGKTNYFQNDKGGLTAPNDIQAKQFETNKVKLTWNTAYAGDNPINFYELSRNGSKVAQVPHKPQVTEIPFEYIDVVENMQRPEYRIVTIDKKGNRVESESIRVV